MKKFLPILASLILAALVFGSAYAFSAPAATPAVAAKPTKPANHPGQGHGVGGNPGQGRGNPGNPSGPGGPARRGGPCGQPARPNGPPAFATTGKVHYDGTLTAVDASSVTLSTTLSGTVTLALTADTCVHMPPRRNATLSDLAVGQRVGVQAVPGTGGSPVAVRILVHKPRKITFVGTVTAYAPGASLTLQPEDGSSPLTFALTAGTDIKPWHRVDELAVGSQVTVQAVRDFAGPNPPVLRLIVHGPDEDDDD